MAVDPIIECFCRDIVPVYYHDLESNAVNTAPPFFVESLQGCSNRSLPRLPLHMHAEDIIPTVLTSSIYIGCCLPKALTLSPLQSDEMFEVFLIIGINKSVGLRRIINFPLLRDTLLYRLARGILLQDGVP